MEKMLAGSNCDFSAAPLEDGDLRLQFVECAPHPVHKVPTYRFRMVHSQNSEELGGINLRPGSTPHLELYAGHIGSLLSGETSTERCKFLRIR
jgi:hypothetical protein